MKVILENVNSDNSQLLKQLAKALGLKFKIEEELVQDETAYLKSSPAMVKHLNEAIEQEKRGEGVKVLLDDIWK